MFLHLAILCLCLASIKCDDCGPLGYDATNLLWPSYWYFDLEGSKCPLLPEDNNFINNANATGCRIYFNLCKNQMYQCAGAVCARYWESPDLVTLLGAYKPQLHPFHEGNKRFSAQYIGEKLKTAAGAPKNVQTRINFNCNKNAHWNYTNSNYHGGSIVPEGLLQNVTYNNVTNKFTVNFKSAEACPYYPPNDSETKKLSYGSLALMLFFPGVLLYFILGALFNRMKGAEGKDMIPHRTFWVDLPELIMDGFIFTMATVTCKHEDRFTKEYEEVE